MKHVLRAVLGLASKIQFIRKFEVLFERRIEAWLASN